MKAEQGMKEAQYELWLQGLKQAYLEDTKKKTTSLLT